MHVACTCSYLLAYMPVCTLGRTCTHLVVTFHYMLHHPESQTGCCVTNTGGHSDNYIERNRKEISGEEAEMLRACDEKRSTI